MFADLTTEAATLLYGRDHVAASTSISGHLDDLRVAHGWALTHDLELAARLVGSLMLYVEHRMPVEVRQWAERTLRAAEDTDSVPSLAGVYAVAAAGARFAGDLRDAVELAERGLLLANDATTTAYLHVVLAEVALFEGRLDDVEQQRAAVVALADTSDLGAVLMLSELVEPLVAAYRGDEERASRVAEDIETRAARSGAGPIEAWARYLRAEALLDSDPERAADLLDGAMELARAQGDRYADGVAMVSAASVRSRHGDPELAVPLFREVIEHWSSLGDWTHQWTSLRGVVDVLLRLDRHEDAAILRGGLVDRAQTAPIYGPDAERMSAAETVLRQRLGDELFGKLTRRGARMGDDAVVAFARTALAPTDLPTDLPAQRRG
jgi:ATP/maltotriose-dependent transcriptional regulator MalT